MLWCRALLRFFGFRVLGLGFLSLFEASKIESEVPFMGGTYGKDRCSFGYIKPQTLSPQPLKKTPSLEMPRRTFLKSLTL